MEKKISFILFLLCCLIAGCTQDKLKDKATPDELFSSGVVPETGIGVKKIDLSALNPTRDAAEGLLYLDSYIRLSNEELIGDAERVLIADDRIYILDNTSKIVCFNMQGKVLFKINSKGQGPEEYIELSDFALDTVNNRIVILDNSKRKLLFYSLDSGKFISEKTFDYCWARAMAVLDGNFYFSNPDKDTYDKDKKKEFYLFYSETGDKIDGKFLPHDAISEFNFLLNNGHPFFYSGDRLLYNRAFDGMVYKLEPNRITPLYEISLPNQLPMKEIEAKINHSLLAKSGYSYGLCDIFEADSMLYFTFSKDGLLASVFYDLDSDKMLYCGYRVLERPSRDLPFYYPITGAYKDKFFSLVPAYVYLSEKNNSQSFFSDDLMHAPEDSNPLIAFYKVRK